MNDEFNVSNIIKATSLNVFVQDKIDVVNANAFANKEVLTAHLVKSLFLSLGASKVSQANLSRVESLSSANTSLATTTAGSSKTKAISVPS